MTHVTQASYAEGSTSLPQGPPPRPEGESARPHGGTTEEESSLALAKRIGPRAVAPTTRPASAGAKAWASCARRSRARAGQGPEGRTRASMRLLIDIRALGGPGMLLRQALYDVQRYATTASNLVMRAYYRQDSQSLDDFQLQHGRLPKTAAEWPSKRINGYQLIRAGVPLLQHRHRLGHRPRGRDQVVPRTATTCSSGSRRARRTTASAWPSRSAPPRRGFSRPRPAS